MTATLLLRNVEVACCIFERLALQSGDSVDRSRIRRSIEYAQAAWPEESTENWWQWIVEAGHSLDLKCKVVDCTFEQLQQVVRDGAIVVAHGIEATQWMAVTGYRKRKFQVYCPLSIYPDTWLTRTQFQKFLKAADAEKLHRCVVIEPTLSSTAAISDAGPATPLQRLLDLLRPEALDLWIIVLFSLVTGLMALATPLAVETLVNTVAFGRFVQPIVVLSLLLLGFLLFSGVIQSLQAYAAEILQRRLFARVTADLAYRLPRVQYHVWEREYPREVVNRFFDIVTVQKVLTHFLLDGAGLILNTLIGMAILGFYHPWLLGFDVLMILLIAFAIFVLGRGAIATSIKESKVKYRMAAWLQDLAASPIAFRSDAAPEFALERTDRMIYDYLIYRRKHFAVLLRQIVFILILQAIASTVLLGLGGWLVIAGQLTLGQLVAAELIVTVIIGSFAKLDKHIESFYDLMAAMDKLGVMHDLPLEPQHGSLEPLPHGAAELVVENLKTWSGAEMVNFHINPQEHTAIYSASSAGKTQLLDVLFAMSIPSTGSARINGVDTRSLRSDVLRQQVALVRGVEIFGGTIEEQVHLERPNISANDVRKSLEIVGLLNDLLKLERGLETVLSASGYPLVPQQISRLMLARGIVSQPQLLMIDGTLDSLSDADAFQLVSRLTEPNQSWTLLLVTAREGLATQVSKRIDYVEIPKTSGRAHHADAGAGEH